MPLVFLGDMVTDFLFLLRYKSSQQAEGKKQFFTYMQKNASAKDTGGWIFAAFAPEARRPRKT
jgi:hypothetical protein